MKTLAPLIGFRSHNSQVSADCESDTPTYAPHRPSFNVYVFCPPFLLFGSRRFMWILRYFKKRRGRL